MFSLRVGSVWLSANKPSLQKTLHVATSVYDAVDDDIRAQDPIDHAPRLMVQFPIFGNSDTRQLLRNISADGEFFKLGTRALKLRQNALCRLGAVAAGDKSIEILDVAFRILSEKNTIWH